MKVLNMALVKASGQWTGDDRRTVTPGKHLRIRKQSKGTTRLAMAL